MPSRVNALEDLMNKQNHDREWNKGNIRWGKDCHPLKATPAKLVFSICEPERNPTNAIGRRRSDFRVLAKRKKSLEREGEKLMIVVDKWSLVGEGRRNQENHDEERLFEVKQVEGDRKIIGAAITIDRKSAKLNTSVFSRKIIMKLSG